LFSLHFGAFVGAPWRRGIEQADGQFPTRLWGHIGLAASLHQFLSVSKNLDAFRLAAA
jgi:hypothetical protein